MVAVLLGAWIWGQDGAVASARPNLLVGLERSLRSKRLGVCGRPKSAADGRVRRVGQVPVCTVCLSGFRVLYGGQRRSKAPDATPLSLLGRAWAGERLRRLFPPAISAAGAVPHSLSSSLSTPPPPSSHPPILAVSLPLSPLPPSPSPSPETCLTTSIAASSPPSPPACARNAIHAEVVVAIALPLPTCPLLLLPIHPILFHLPLPIAWPEHAPIAVNDLNRLLAPEPHASPVRCISLHPPVVTTQASWCFPRHLASVPTPPPGQSTNSKNHTKLSPCRILLSTTSLPRLLHLLLFFRLSIVHFYLPLLSPSLSIALRPCT